MLTVYKDILDRYPSWPALSTHLKSVEGGRLEITTTGSYAVIHYVKGTSNLDLGRPYRSVVWNIETNRPVSITPWKSEIGETLPTDSIDHYQIETFLDGVLIGQFWDGTCWRLHTRSILDATNQYYSRVKTFADMFREIAPADLESRLDKTHCYSCILRHPENRIVCEIRTPSIHLVGAHQIHADGSVQIVPRFGFLTKVHTFPDWTSLRFHLRNYSHQYGHNFQGFVIRNEITGQRWKVRTDAYNKARLIRGNTPKREFMWLSAWKADTLSEYQRIYPEEKRLITTLLDRWKSLTRELYSLYTYVYITRTTTVVPRKWTDYLRHLHIHYIKTLKPSGQLITLYNTIEWMNQRDVPHMLFLLNYEMHETNGTLRERSIRPLFAPRGPQVPRRTSTGMTPVEGASAPEPSGGDLPVQELSGQELSGQELSGGETSGGETSGGDLPVQELSGGDLPAPETSGGETSGGDLPAPETSGGDLPAPETSGPETSAPETSGGETSGGELSVQELSGPETSGGESLAETTSRPS
jgi:hypothetical protein